MKNIQSDSVPAPAPFRRHLKRLGMALSTFLIGGHTIFVLGYWFLRLLGVRMLLVTALSYVAPWLFLPLIVLLPIAFLRRSRWLIAGEAACLALFVLLYGGWFLPRRPARVPQTTFTVMTHNILWTNPHLDQITAEVKAGSPDIVGLQELSSESWAALEPELSALYPYRYISADCGLLSRYPLEACEDIVARDSSRPRTQKCEVNLDGRRITLFNAHPRSPYLDTLTLGRFTLPGALHTSLHDADVAVLLEQVRSTQGPALVMGDLNFSPQHQPYRDFMAELQDSYRERGWGPGFTFSCRPCAHVPVWRLDYLFHSAEISTLDIQVGDYHGSDHRAVLATLGFSTE